MDKRTLIDKSWELYYYDAIDGFSCKADELDKKNIEHIPATVPGNVEIDLAAAGVIPADLFKGMATQDNEKFETYEWWYSTEIEVKKTENRLFLHFEAVDCIADYYLNDVKISESKNAFIPHEIDITDIAKNGKNSLKVHIKSSLMYTLAQQYDNYLFTPSWLTGVIFARKAQHSFGWDIFPRAVSAGIWRKVWLIERDNYQFDQVSYIVNIENNVPKLRINFSVNAPFSDLIKKKLTVRVKGVCGEDSSFAAQMLLDRHQAGKLYCKIDNPKLWWPYGYGEANIYDTVIELVCGDTVLAEKKFNVGLRTVELDTTEIFENDEGHFQFIVNGVPVMCRGSNWVPMDAYHSRDNSRYAKALELASEIGCNMLRCWGGGVYEDEDFYDYCDRHGIMIWQDFMMACQLVPYDDEMLKVLEEEFTYIIKTFRTHPSIAVWAGDNEIDEMLAGNKISSELNVVPRTLLPKLVTRHDGTRPFIASSPYIDSKNFLDYSKGKDKFVERHLWGPRDYFKSAYYANSRACFVSETGYHGCPSPESVRKIVDEECVWPFDNEQWTLHSSDQKNNPSRVKLMIDQIKQLFAFEPDNLEDYSLASQISQAEAKKYFIERMRCGRPQKTGVLWWNLIDGWPQMSDAVVDYFYDKKLAFEYIKHSQAPFALVMDEMKSWQYTLVAANDTLTEKVGTYKVSDIETGEVLTEGNFEAAANASTPLTNIRMMYSDKRMLLIEWDIDGKKYYNHYLCGMPGFSFEKYKSWLEKLNKYYNT